MLYFISSFRIYYSEEMNRRQQAFGTSDFCFIYKRVRICGGMRVCSMFIGRRLPHFYVFARSANIFYLSTLRTYYYYYHFVHSSRFHFLFRKYFVLVSAFSLARVFFSVFYFTSTHKTYKYINTH